MKYLVLLFITSLCFAAPKNFIAKEGWNDCKQKDARFSSQSDCENHYGSECIDATGKVCQFDKIQPVEVDDHTKPIYAAKENVMPCENQGCYTIIAPVCGDPIPLDDGGVDQVCNNYCDDYEGYNAYVNEDKTEVYCTKLTGYQKKTIDKLVEDAALKAAYEAEKAAKEQAKVDKAAKKAAAKERIKGCNDQICKDLVDILEL